MRTSILGTVSAVLLGSTASVSATPIAIDAMGSPWEVFNFVSQVGQNSVGRTPGRSLTFGILGVTPNGKGEDSRIEGEDKVLGDGTATIGTATQDGVLEELFHFASTVGPNQLVTAVRGDAVNVLTGSWDFELTNGTDSRSFSGPAICDSTVDADCATKLLTAPATNVEISFATGDLTPTFSWSLEEEVDQVSVSLYDLNVRDGGGDADRIFVESPGPEAETFTIPESWGLEEDGKYAFRIDTRKLRSEENGTAGVNPSGSSQEGAAIAETITFYDFTPGLIDIAEEFKLPIDITINPDGNPIFNFDNPVVAEEVEFYDPIVAIGYDYMVGASDPLFNSFILPEIGDNLFDLFLWNGTDYLFEANVSSGIEYIFGADFGFGGVDRFRIMGIETALGLDPTDATAFATGLSFTADGRFTGTMTPITVFVDDPVAPVPLPATLPMLIAALGTGIGFRMRSQKS